MIQMRELLSLVLFVFLLFGIELSGQGRAREFSPQPSDSIKIDRIEIERNWMTWDRIILNELLFE
ncbi:MAG: hypothetical protein QNK35_07635 [Bacteroides sp.]|nr:hypothetical protein [Bacteroides sp.]